MLPYHSRLLHAVNSFQVQGITFDGVNDYLTRGADLTGNSDGKQGTFSCWVKFDPAADGQDICIYANDNDTFVIDKPLHNRIRVNVNNSSGATRMNLISDSTYTSADGWLHILASWDVNALTGKLYINGADDEASPSLTNDTLDYTRGNHWIGRTAYDIQKFDGDLAEFWLAQEYLDLSVAANRAKFSTGRRPANLGTDGSRPTGNSPIIYLSSRPGDLAANFGTNKGTGGNFSITGTLAISSTPPSY